MRITNISSSTSSKVKWGKKKEEEKEKNRGDGRWTMRNLPRKKRGRQRASVLEYVGRVSRGGRGKGSRGGRKSVAALLETRPFNATADDCQRNWIIPLRNFTSFHVILRRINRKDWSTNNPRKKKIEGGEKKKKERKKERNTRILVHLETFRFEDNAILEARRSMR